MGIFLHAPVALSAAVINGLLVSAAWLSGFTLYLTQKGHGIGGFYAALIAMSTGAAFLVGWGTFAFHLI